MKKILFPLLVLSFLAFTACSDDSEDDNSSVTQSMTVTKNGTDYSISSFNNTLINTAQLGQSGKRLDLRCNVDGGLLILSVSNWDWQNPPANGVILKKYNANGPQAQVPSDNECSTIDNYTFCDGGLVSYKVDGSNVTQLSTEEETDEAYIKITANNTTDKTVTGEFHAIVKDFFGNDSIHFEGSFSNLNYSVY